MNKIFAALATTGLLICGTAQAETKITFAISTPLGAMGQMSGQRYTDLVNEKLGDLGSVEYYHSAQLGPDKDLMQKLKLGSVQLTHMASVMPNYVPETAIFEMPFLVKDRAHVKAIGGQWLQDRMVPAFEAQGYKLIAFWENGFRHISNDRHPIVTPDDLASVKIRTPNSRWRAEMFRTFGANPTPMPFSEVFIGLQTGAIDGQENPLVHMSANRMDEVQDYLSLSGHVYSPVFLLTTTRQWEAWPEEVRTILSKTAQEILPWIYDTMDEADERLVGELEGRGMEVNTVDRDAFVAASAPVYEIFDQEIDGGKAMIQEVLELGN
ncbi:TRAP transporter substrate-binding protein [Szabonella alba]|uniref:TRAP transporter substrate-binding protein n=1 Tax=Szabonella alba TaxID=2804194 RepID=A0A8K0VBL7_9RHOB|nr:TRAP transporter substrate-binding protein [Szabonella alba]MBL4919194.1 TRAP transporter substrate-binding protein [Szabonella alba]